MRAKSRMLIASSIIVSLGLSGCANMTPEQKAGALGALTGTGAYAIAAHNNVNPLGAAAIGIVTGLIVAKVTYDYEVRRANETQMRIAQERARQYQADVASEQRKHLARQPGQTRPGSGSSRAHSAPAAVKQPARYIAVQTPRTSESTGAATVMIYDTESKDLVNNNAYDIRQTPRNGEMAKLDKYDVQFVSAQ